MMGLQFDTTLKAGDLLTSITIAISVVTLVLTLAKDRATRVTEEANKVRTAAATTLAKLDRWQQVELSLYRRLQPDFVGLSERLAAKYDVVATRDEFWKQVAEARTEVAKQVLEEQLQTSYGDLIAHFPAARKRIIDTLSELDKVEVGASDNFMAIAEQAILRLKGRQSTFQTPQLGNELRAAAATGAAKLRADSDHYLDPLRSYLFSLITLTDEQLVNSARSTASSR